MRKTLTAFFIPAIIGVISCHHRHTRAEVEASMHQYDSLLQTMNANAVSKMFAPDGKLGDVAQGRDSIKNFLSGFTNVKVISQNSDTKSIELKGDSATQTGKYFQTDVINGKDTVRLKGNYITKWKWLDGEGWKIEKITTQHIQ